MTEQQSELTETTAYGRATWIAAAGTFAMVAVAVFTAPLSLHASQLLATVALLCVGFACARYYGLRIESLRPTPSGVLIALVFGCGLGIFGTGAASLVSAATEALFEGTAFGESLQRIAVSRQASLQQLLFVDRPTMIPLVMLVIAVAPAICEEYAYRGVVPAALNEPRRVPRILFIGFLFAVMHVDPFALLPLLVVGAGLQWYAERAAGWSSAAVAHFALNGFNGIVFARLYGLAPPPPGLAAAMMVVGLGAAAVGLRFARR